MWAFFRFVRSNQLVQNRILSYNCLNINVWISGRGTAMLFFTKRLRLFSVRAFFVGLITVVVLSALWYLEGPPFATMTGVVESITAGPVNSKAWPQISTVRLGDGSQVQAAVAHDCGASPGQMVNVQMSRFRPGPRKYYVISVEKGEGNYGQPGK
jgi:hypothetical protein